MQDTQGFFDKAALQEHPLRALVEFLEQERNNEIGKHYDKLRFVGYVLDIGYETVTIITSDPFKTAVGGVPRNSLLIMVPANLDGLPPHFTLLRVLQAAATPLASEVQQTYFELQKKSMPELDVFTQAELQWGALQTGVLGMFYPSPDSERANEVEFSGDLNNFVSAHRYRVYAPTDNLLDLIVNSLVPDMNRFEIGKLRMTENRLPLPAKSLPNVDAFVTADDFKGTRTALFGKTRLGKSNVVKLIAESIIKTTEVTGGVGQVIFDSDGEYANDNPQDGSTSLASAYGDSCSVYAITPKESTDSKPLKLDFYSQPHAGLPILRTLLQEAGKDSSNYIRSFLAVDLPDVDTIEELPHGERTRAKRKILIYWSVLHRAGYPADIQKLRDIVDLDPKFSNQIRTQIYRSGRPPRISNLDTLAHELELLADANRPNPLPSSSGGGKPLFDPEDEALLDMLKPAGATSTGPRLLQPFTKYHSKEAGDFVTDIIDEVNKGLTVILDLGNAAPELMSYFSAYLSREIFHHQVDKFSNDNLGKHYVQLYFEEAHNLFPVGKPHEKPIYQRLAKEGAKYHIGMVYSTQSVTTIDKDLLAQTENFFIAHMSSQDEVNALAKVNIAFDGLQQDILVTRTLGYIRMLTRSHRFVVPVQARKFQPDTKPNGERTANAAVANPSSNGASIIDGRVPQRET